MSIKMKLLPAMITLIAGAVTSIMAFLFHYEGKTTLLILSIVLLLFYILGLILQRVILAFEDKNAKEKAKQEGKVVEKGKDKQENMTPNDDKKEKSAQDNPNGSAIQDNSKEAPIQDNSKEIAAQESQN